MSSGQLPRRLRLLRVVAHGFLWLPAAFALAAVVVGVVVLTTGWLRSVWIAVLASLIGLVGFTSVLLTAWGRKRIRLFEYEHAEGPWRDDELEAAEASDRFEQLVQQALDEIPPQLRAQMSNVSVVVEDEPPPERRLLGLYQGIPLTRRSRWDSGSLPDKITIYRGPIERYSAHDPERLAREVRRTVLHEVAHHFGISDERLVEIDRY